MSKGWRPPSLPEGRLRRRLHELAGRIPDPADKLWFIQQALARYERLPRSFRRSSLLRGATARFATLAAMDDLYRKRRVVPRPAPPQPWWTLYRARHALTVVLGVGIVLLAYTSGYAAYRAATEGVDLLVTLWRPFDVVGLSSRPSPAAGAKRSALPNRRVGPRPERVWLVEEGPQGELWSNGLRVSNSYQIRTEVRRYLVFPRTGDAPELLHERPAGIVYHTSQSGMAPFEPGHNASILRNTRGLLRWLRKHANYHYLIDRFGRVYRIVADSDVAYHAGRSVWADERNYYLDLNDSFLGVCFESEWNARAGTSDLITAAQVQAGMNLTDMLRARYGIPDATAVPHGLISVNAKKMLIGHHLDWARGFPFAALGLSNKYEIPLPSILGFGFGYDEHLLESLDGKLWPGIAHAEAELRRRAVRLDTAPATLTRQLRRLYRQYRHVLETAKENDLETVAKVRFSPD